MAWAVLGCGRVGREGGSGVPCEGHEGRKPQKESRRKDKSETKGKEGEETQGSKGRGETAGQRRLIEGAFKEIFFPLREEKIAKNIE